MPVFNAQDDAVRTLASFVEDAPVFALVVDDGSATPFVCPPLHNGVSVEVLRLEKNGGIEAALAAGVDRLLASGIRFIARIDAGDRATPGRLAAQRRFMLDHPEVGGLGMAAQVVSRHGEPLFFIRPPSDPAQIRRRRFARSCFVHPTMMLRDLALRASGNYRRAYPAAEDLDLFLRIMEHYDCANLPDIGVLYELNETGVSGSRRQRQIISTLQLQLAYPEPANPYYWAGLAKHLAHLLVPYRWLAALKRKVLA
ncbi:MAG: glycosyltransferase [Janthinobacterium lividum]